MPRRPQPQTVSSDAESLPVGPYTTADWPTFEADKERKHELRNGEFIEMAGAAFEHNLIATNFIIELGVALRGTGCRVVDSDQKIDIDGTNGFYPDVVVYCGQPMITPQDALQNPVLIVEVLRPSTAADDRGAKFAKYRTVATLQHYLLVEPNFPSVEHHQKGEDGRWLLIAEPHTLEETLTLTLGGKTVSIPLAVLYEE